MPLSTASEQEWFMAKAARTQLDNVLLSSTPGTRSPWARATGRTYDIRVDDYGRGDYTLSANVDRVRAGTVGWICHRDGGLGAVAGLIVFDDGPTIVEADSGYIYRSGDTWPLPRDYWVDGGRLRVRRWTGAPFASGPSQFQNGRVMTPENFKILYRELHPAVKDWLDWHPLRRSRGA